MQSTAIQMRTRTKNPLTAAQQNDQVTGAGSQLADPFLQIIMNLLSQTYDQTPQQSTQQNQQQVDVTALTGSQTEPNQLNALTQLLQGSPVLMTALLDALFTGGSVSTDTSQNGTSAIASLMGTGSKVADNTSLENLLAALNVGKTSPQTELASLLSQPDTLSTLTKSAPTATISSEALTQLTELLGLTDKNELLTALKNAGVEVTVEQAAPEKDGFLQAVTKAKEGLSSSLSQKKDESADVDVDVLQNLLSKNGVTTPFELRFKAAGSSESAKLLEQLTDGIKQNISLGKNEFTIKLKPETLGEITVKLIEDAGKTTLSITTASAQTAKLINSDLDALKQAVAPMNVEVRNAVVATNETANGSMQQFAGQQFAGQQFTGQQFAGQQNFLRMSQGSSSADDGLIPEDRYTAVGAVSANAVSNDRLDTYI